MQLVAETLEILGGQSLFKQPVRSANDLDREINEGLPTESLTSTISTVTPPAGHAPSVALDRIIPLSTWKRRVKVGRLSRDESDKVVRLAHVVAVARHVIGDDRAVRAFFQTPHAMLAGRRPADAALTTVGAQQIEDILWGVFYGLPV